MSKSSKGSGTPPSDTVQRAVLPIPEPGFNGWLPFDARDSAAQFPPVPQVRPPQQAPNILVILLNDVGFGASSAFGGPCHTPIADKLARHGLRYNRFHTTGFSGPTRAALLTGRNHHSVGVGGIAEFATSSPGYTSIIPRSAASIAKILHYNGYSTAHFGKCHEVPVWENSPVGPFDHWPTGNGFDKFYGFIANETNQWYPEVYDGTTRVEITKNPGYHFMADMTNKAIEWVRMQKSLAPDRPFFIYFAPSATQAPHHVPSMWADRYKGQFDEGWDKLRERIISRQKELGIIPKTALLTKRPTEIPAWDDMPEDLKPVLRRQMEVYAGYLEYGDFNVGRLLDAMVNAKVLENTLIFYILGDNGASAAGGINGTFNEMININGAAELETPEFLIKRINEIGGPSSYSHYSAGWAHALCTPYQWTKQIASHFGGTRNGTIVHWPRGISSKNEIRSQFTHIIDVFPTILEAAKIPAPTLVEGISQMPVHGTSMLYTFNNPKSPERHKVQYFEMFGNRALYFKGWMASARHSLPWIFNQKLPSPDHDKWELYDTAKDWTQALDISHLHPDKLEELKRLWLIEAARHQVLPIDDRRTERIFAEGIARPKVVRGSRQFLFEGMVLGKTSTIDIKNKSYSITAEIEVPESGAEGVIIAQGANFGGWALYAHQGQLKYVYNFLGLATYFVTAPGIMLSGRHRVRMTFDYDGGGVGKGGTVGLFIDSRKVAEGRVQHTHSTVFSSDSTTMVGRKNGAPICGDFTVSGNQFSGKINWVVIELGAVDDDHYLSKADQLRIALSLK